MILEMLMARRIEWAQFGQSLSSTSVFFVMLFQLLYNFLWYVFVLMDYLWLSWWSGWPFPFPFPFRVWPSASSCVCRWQIQVFLHYSLRISWMDSGSSDCGAAALLAVSYCPLLFFFFWFSYSLNYNCSWFFVLLFFSLCIPLQAPCHYCGTPRLDADTAAAGGGGGACVDLQFCPHYLDKELLHLIRRGFRFSFFFLDLFWPHYKLYRKKGNNIKVIILKF